jgi:hypothetical protein
MAHGYQGLAGILGTAFLGAFRAVIFVVAARLWHRLRGTPSFIDLRLLSLLVPRRNLIPLGKPSNA